MAEAIVRHGKVGERREDSDIAEMIQADLQGEGEEELDEHGKRVPVVDDFVYNHVGLTDAEAKALLEKYGKNELPEKIIPKWRLFLDQFRAPMPIMIWLAIIIEAAITNWIDMAILLVIQFTNASISFYELNKAGNAVKALKNSLKPTATCKRNGTWEVINATLLVPGDLVLLASGSGESEKWKRRCVCPLVGPSIVVASDIIGAYHRAYLWSAHELIHRFSLFVRPSPL
jgi:magnesium-transporting ATPase (P-type)